MTEVPTHKPPFWKRALAHIGLGRHPSEPVSTWLRRIEAAHPAAHRLHPIAELHCRHRFDPAGLTVEERDWLRSSVATWLAESQSSLASQAGAQ